MVGGKKMADREYLGYFHDGSWVGAGEEYEVYVDEDGVLRLERCLSFQGRWNELMPFRYKFGKKYFGDEKFLVGLKSEAISKLVMKCNGKKEQEIAEIIGKFRDKRDLYKSCNSVQWEEWVNLRNKFNWFVIGLDRDIDVYGEGFSVRVLFRTDISFEDRKRFLKENRMEFLLWVIGEVSNSKRMVKKIGDISFYKPVEIINLRMPEVEVKFEVKGEAA